MVFVGPGDHVNDEDHCHVPAEFAGSVDAVLFEECVRVGEYVDGVLERGERRVSWLCGRRACVPKMIRLLIVFR